MPDASTGALEWLLGEVGGAQGSMEEFSVFHHGSEQEFLSHRFPDLIPQIDDQPLDVDLRCADLVAFPAADAEFQDIFRLVEAVEEGGEYQPDAADVDVAKYMAADDLIDRADVGAGSALDAF